MKLLTTVTAIFLASSMGLTTTTAEAASHISYDEKRLIKVCKASMSQSLLKYNHTLKFYRLKNNNVARQVVCNGQEIADFARSHGSNRVAAKLERTLNKTTSITDIAKMEKIHVTFDES